MHHRAVILSAEHAPDDGVGVAKQFAAQVHGKLAGLHEIRAALLTEDFLGRDAAVLTDDTDDELRGQRGAVAALPHDVEQILFGKIAAEQGAVGRHPEDDAGKPPDIRAVLRDEQQLLPGQGQAAEFGLLLGALAFAISVYDGFQSTLTRWISRYISIYLWLPVSDLFSSVLARIQTLMLQKDIEQLSDPNFIPDGSSTVYVIFMIIGIVGYFTIPTVASWIVSAGGTSAYNRNVARAGSIAGAAVGAAGGKVSGKLLK